MNTLSAYISAENDLLALYHILQADATLFAKVGLLADGIGWSLKCTDFYAFSSFGNLPHSNLVVQNFGIDKEDVLALYSTKGVVGTSALAKAALLQSHCVGFLGAGQDFVLKRFTSVLLTNQ